jgi:hypothetical protein
MKKRKKQNRKREVENLQRKINLLETHIIILHERRENADRLAKRYGVV